MCMYKSRLVDCRLSCLGHWQWALCHYVIHTHIQNSGLPSSLDWHGVSIHRPLIDMVCPHDRFLLLWSPWRKTVVMRFSNILIYFHLRASQNQIHSIHGGSHSGSHSDPWSGAPESHHPHFLRYDAVRVQFERQWQLPYGKKHQPLVLVLWKS